MTVRRRPEECDAPSPFAAVSLLIVTASLISGACGASVRSSHPGETVPARAVPAPIFPRGRTHVLYLIRLTDPRGARGFRDDVLGFLVTRKDVLLSYAGLADAAAGSVPADDFDLMLDLVFDSEAASQAFAADFEKRLREDVRGSGVRTIERLTLRDEN